MPEIGGHTAPGFEGVREAFAANLAHNREIGAAAGVYLHFPGHGGSLGFADPATGLAFGYVMNHIQDGASDLRAATLLDAVRRAMLNP